MIEAQMAISKLFRDKGLTVPVFEIDPGQPPVTRSTLRVQVGEHQKILRAPQGGESASDHLRYCLEHAALLLPHAKPLSPPPVTQPRPLPDEAPLRTPDPPAPEASAVPVDTRRSRDAGTRRKG